jgi:hypothetical protein
MRFDFSKLRWLLIFVALTAHAEDGASVNPGLGKVVAECKSPNATSHVWIFKQWHLSPGVDTKNSKQQSYGQSKNQIAIYNQLNSWISSGKINTVFAEGCSGQMSAGFRDKFNGWSFADLKTASKKDGYEKIVSHVPLKLEAKYGDKLNTVCADDAALVKEHNLAFSDARGTSGFYTRLIEFKNDRDRVKNYLDGTVELFKLPKSTTPDQAIAFLHGELKKCVEKINETGTRRSKKMAEIIAKSKTKDAAFVVGGIHTTELVSSLESAGIGCTVVEPYGYVDDAEKLVANLNALLN